MRNGKRDGDMQLQSVSATDGESAQPFLALVGSFHQFECGEKAHLEQVHRPAQPVPDESLMETTKNSTPPPGAATLVHQYQPETWVNSLSQSAITNRTAERLGSESSSLTGPILRMLLAMSLAAVCLPRALSAVHPVPLDPKTDSAKCLECTNSRRVADPVRKCRPALPDIGQRWSSIRERRVCRPVHQWHRRKRQNCCRKPRSD